MKRFPTIVLALMFITSMALVTGCKPEENKLPENAHVIITTKDPMFITQTAAICPCEVEVTQDLLPGEYGQTFLPDDRGVCWNTESNPTVEHAHLSSIYRSQYFCCTLTHLEPGTIYHIRAYALFGTEYFYGEDKCFTTVDHSDAGSIGYVDLGLPSGTLWATCNLGANCPEGYGDYFAWGEIEPKNNYNYDSYKYCNYSSESILFTKYCTKPEYGANGFVDNLIELQSEDDAATAYWGCDWHVPTSVQWEELMQNTTPTYVAQNGVDGCLFTSDNGKSLFLPLQGRRWGEGVWYHESVGLYWSSSLGEGSIEKAMCLFFISSNCKMEYCGRIEGLPIRPVRSSH